MSSDAEKDNPRLVRSAHGGTITPERMEEAYHAVLGALRSRGLTPDALLTSAPNVKGIGSSWGSFQRKRKRLEESRFRGVRWFGFGFMAGDGKVSNAIHGRSDQVSFLIDLALPWCHVGVWWNPHDSRFDFLLVDDVFALAADAFGCVRGRESREEMLTPLVPQDRSSEAFRAFDADKKWWSFKESPVDRATSLLTRVGGVTYVSGEQLDAPMGLGGGTLREWISEDAHARGELREFGCSCLTEWRVPAERVGEINEALFRGGRLFTSGFFTDQSGPYARPDLLAPWAWEGQTPPQFRPVFEDELREIRDQSRLRFASNRAREESDRRRARKEADERRLRYVDAALETLPAGPPATPREVRDRITRFHGMEYVAHRRYAMEPVVTFDFRELERITGRVLEQTVLHTMAYCRRERFLYRSTEEIAEELVRLEREGFPDVEPQDPVFNLLGVDARGFTGFVWKSDPPPPPLSVVCLSLEEFFDGNTDPGSITVEDPKKAPQPTLLQCRETLFAFRDRDEIEGVFIQVHEFPDPDDPDDDEMWFRAGGLVVYSRAATLRETKFAMKPIGLRWIWQGGERSLAGFERLPERPDGTRAHTARWLRAHDWPRVPREQPRP